MKLHRDARKERLYTQMNRNTVLYGVLIVMLGGLFLLDICCGSVFISLHELFSSDGLYHQILLDLRLPKALTAVLAGSALSVTGLMMQTLFRNPLAGPYILGVSSGATLGVAIVVLLGSLIGWSMGGWGIASAAIMGATLILLVVMALSHKVHSNVSLLIIGMMFGNIAGAVVTLLQSLANPDSLKLFVVWTLGSLSSVGWHDMWILLPIYLLGAGLCLVLLKPLNGLLLGEQYAQGLGIHIPRTRGMIVAATGLLAGSVTAFCGPIAFVGVAVPHIARGIFSTSNHRITMPASALIGANLLLLCDFISSLFTYPLPISTVSALFGAPVIIWIILKK